MIKLGCSLTDGHILDQTPQTEVHTKKQLPMYSGSGPIKLTWTGFSRDAPENKFLTKKVFEAVF